MDTEEAIVLSSLLNKITTTVDGGWNLTFSVSQAEAQKLVKLSELRDELIQLVIVPQKLLDTKVD